MRQIIDFNFIQLWEVLEILNVKQEQEVRELAFRADKAKGLSTRDIEQVFSQHVFGTNYEKIEPISNIRRTEFKNC